MDREVNTMSEQQFERMEDMLTQLVGMVAKNNEKVDTITKEMQTMTGEIASIREDQQSMSTEISFIKKDQQSMSTDNGRRHEEIMRKFNTVEADQDYTWEKTARNEREIAKIKEQKFGS